MHRTIPATVFVPIAVFVLTAGPVAAQPGGSLTAGSAIYVQQPGPTGESLASPTGVQFRAEAPPSPSQMFQNWWYYRVQGDTREYPFGNYARSAGGSVASTTNQYLGNTATVQWTDTSAAAATRFTATYISQLTDDGTNAATLAQSFQINNPNAAPLVISLFNFADIDANGQAVSDADTATGNTGAITIQDGLFRIVHSVTGSVPANAFQVAQFSGVRDFLLDGNVNNLNNTGLPFGPGDYTGAFQWDLTVPALGSVTVNSNISINPVPEPGTLLLGGAVTAAGVAWRRRRAR
jgi:hypothetical protein